MLSFLNIPGLGIWQGCEYARDTNSSEPPPLFIGGSESWLPPPGGDESEKLKKVGGSMVQGQVFLKGGVGTFSI